MPASVLDLCTPAESAFSTGKSDTVAAIGDFLADRIDADAFFGETHPTAGMSQLLTAVFDRLDGRSPQGVFRLKQSMGGGKTHNLIAAGLLARRPILRKRILQQLGRPTVSLDDMRVVAFDGRNTDGNRSSEPFWISLARQLQPDSSRWPSAHAIPGPSTWAELLGSAPTLILLDELPPYLHAMSLVQAGDGTRADEVVLALANLMQAAMGADSTGRGGRTCIVLSDLQASWQHGSLKVDKAIQAAVEDAVRTGTYEANRVAVDITPVRVDDAELAAILRKRVFTRCPAPSERSPEVLAVRDAYKRAFDTAVQQGAMTTVLRDRWANAIVESYPFHPGLLDIIGRFKENDGFQQTREVLRLARRLVARAWRRGGDATPLLLHPHDFDFGDPDSVALLDGIHPKLSEARRRDVCNAGTATAEALALGDRDAGGAGGADRRPSYEETARLLFFASLGTAAKAVNGLQDAEAGAYLAAPGRDVSAVAEVITTLAEHSWYLHKRADRWVYRDLRNISSMIKDRANEMPADLRKGELKARLQRYFEPRKENGGAEAYQKLLVFPDPTEIKPAPESTLLVIADNQSAQIPAAYKQVWQETLWQNRLLFLTADGRFADVQQHAAYVASAEAVLQDVQRDGAAGFELDQAKDAVARQRLAFETAVQTIYTSLHFPMDNALEKADLGDNKTDGDVRRDLAVRDALIREGKFKDSAFCAASLYPEFMGSLFTQKTMVWKDIKEAAARKTDWYLLPPGADESLKAKALAEGKWRDVPPDKVEQGPFPPAKTSVRATTLSRDADGTCRIEVRPLYADTVHYELGRSVPTAASPKVQGGELTTKSMRVQFLAIDSTGKHPTGPACEWRNTVTLKSGVRHADGACDVHLAAAPDGATIRYTTNGANPRQGALYEAPVHVAYGTLLLAVAELDDIGSETLTVQTPEPPKGPAHWPDLQAPLSWDGFPSRDSVADTLAALEHLDRLRATLRGPILRLRDATDAERYADLRWAPKCGATGRDVRQMWDQLPLPLREGFDVLLEIETVAFPTGQAFLDMLAHLGLQVDAIDRSKVRQ